MFPGLPHPVSTSTQPAPMSVLYSYTHYLQSSHVYCKLLPLLQNCSLGGIESMSITEVFGGKTSTLAAV